jgi:chemotaxis protein methyltransferase CheR
MTDEDFLLLIQFIEKDTGITLPESNYHQVRQFITEGLEHSGQSFHSYLEILSSNPEVYNRLLEAVTINETYFFREEKHFSFLEEQLFPLLSQKNEDINIWSASCSSGEEALSLYALGIQVFGNKVSSFHMYASDISDDMLTRFRKGIYRNGSFREDGHSYAPLIQNLACRDDDGRWMIDSSHIEKIDIKLNNLFQKQGDQYPQMDVIFLRNTLIYMNMENKRIIIDNVAEKLKSGGVLFLSTSELPLISHPALFVEEQGNVYFFRKHDPESLSPTLLKKKIVSAVHSLSSDTSPLPPSPIKRESERERSSEQNLCRRVAIRLNNEICRKGSPEMESAVDIVIKVLYYLQKNDSTGGLQFLEECPEEDVRNFPGLFSFLEGYFYYRIGLTAEAEDKFTECLKYNQDLWPARYYLVRILPECQSRRLDLLQRVIGDIREYIDNHRYDYQFMLEGFNARYFLMICESMLPDIKGRT